MLKSVLLLIMFMETMKHISRIIHFRIINCIVVFSSLAKNNKKVLISFKKNNSHNNIYFLLFTHGLIFSEINHIMYMNVIIIMGDT